MVAAMRGLKALVIGMAILIAVGLAAVVTRLIDLAASGGSGGRSFGEARLGLAPGCRVVEATAGDGRLLLRIGEGAACERVLIVDPASGRVLGALLP